MRRIVLAIAGDGSNHGGLRSLAPGRDEIELPLDPYQVKTVCTAQPVNIGRRVTPTNGNELQQALDTAAAGDTILLQPGVIYTPATADGSFKLRNRALATGQWVVVRSANNAFDARGSIPTGTRVTDANATLMPQIRATKANAPAIKAEPGARGYRLIGLDVAPECHSPAAHESGRAWERSERTLEALPAEIVIDRSYLHGNDTGNYRRGVSMNGINLAVLDSYLADFHDSQRRLPGDCGWNGSGPFKILNNYLEAASENIMFGGNDPADSESRAVRYRDPPQSQYESARFGGMRECRLRTRSS